MNEAWLSQCHTSQLVQALTSCGSTHGHTGKRGQNECIAEAKTSKGTWREPWLADNLDSAEKAAKRGRGHLQAPCTADAALVSRAMADMTSIARGGLAGPGRVPTL